MPRKRKKRPPESTGWVSNRICIECPIDARTKEVMLMLENPAASNEEKEDELLERTDFDTRTTKVRETEEGLFASMSSPLHGLLIFRFDGARTTVHRIPTWGARVDLMDDFVAIITDFTHERIIQDTPNGAHVIIRDIGKEVPITVFPNRLQILTKSVSFTYEACLARRAWHGLETASYLTPARQVWDRMRIAFVSEKSFYPGAILEAAVAPPAPCSTPDEQFINTLYSPF